MSKNKHKDEQYYCCSCTPYYSSPCCCDSCCCNSGCCNSCCCNGMNGMNNGYGNWGNNCGNNNWDNGIIEAVIFWLIACGAGLLNTSSILIILLFLLYGWSCDGNNGLGLFGW